MMPGLEDIDLHSMAAEAIDRHIQRLQSSAAFNNYVTKVTMRAKSAASFERILDLQSKGLVKAMRAAAIKMFEERLHGNTSAFED